MIDTAMGRWPHLIPVYAIRILLILLHVSPDLPSGHRIVHLSNHGMSRGFRVHPLVVSAMFKSWGTSNEFSAIADGCDNGSAAQIALLGTNMLSQEAHGHDVSDLSLGCGTSSGLRLSELGGTSSGVDGVCKDMSGCEGWDRLFLHHEGIEPSIHCDFLCGRCYVGWTWLCGYRGCHPDVIRLHLRDGPFKQRFKETSRSNGHMLDKAAPCEPVMEIYETEKMEFSWGGGKMKFTELTHDAAANVNISQAATFKYKDRVWCGVPTQPLGDAATMPKELETELWHYNTVEKRTLRNNGQLILRPDQQEQWFRALCASADSTRRRSDAPSGSIGGVNVNSPADDMPVLALAAQPAPQTMPRNMVQKQQALEGDSVAAPRGEAQPQQAPDQQTPQLPLPNTQRKRRRLTACKDGAGGLDDAAAIDDAVDALPEASEDCEVVPETMRKVRKLSGLQQVQVETKITGLIKQCPIKFIAPGNQGFASRVNSGQMRTLAKQMETNFSVCQMHFPELDSSLSKAHEVSCTVCWGFRQTMLPDIEQCASTEALEAQSFNHVVGHSIIHLEHTSTLLT